MLGGLFAQTFPDNRDWATILQKYVNQEHRVDYTVLRDRDRAMLDRYSQQLAGPWPKMSANARKAALINAYNSLTIHWILENYPVESIWRTKKPFTEARHTVDGKRVSLDNIETELRALDPRVHSALVCAARSCPPLRREPYGGDAVDRQLDDNLREWLAMPDRNSFDEVRGVASISKIFDWYNKDFDRLGGVRSVLAKYGPPAAAKTGKIEYQRYRWGLNDTSDLGSRYSDLQFYIDKLKN
jgi:Protein of unknown function, DUF547